MREGSRQEVQQKANLPITAVFHHFISLVQKLSFAVFFGVFQIRQTQES